MLCLLLIGFDEDIDMCDVEADNGHGQYEGINPSIQAAIDRATKNFRSTCWKEFEPIIEDGVVVQGRCKHCDTLMAVERGAGTSSLLTHLRRCKKWSRVLGILASRINLQAQEYCCSFHLRVFQGLSNPQGTCVHSLLF